MAFLIMLCHLHRYLIQITAGLCRTVHIDHQRRKRTVLCFHGIREGDTLPDLPEQILINAPLFLAHRLTAGYDVQRSDKRYTGSDECTQLS